VWARKKIDAKDSQTWAHGLRNRNGCCM
jgi:hypothetical protein